MMTARDPRPMKEWQLHGYVADLLRLQARPGVLWFHVPNEGKRAVRTGAFLKRLGMLAGVSDFVVVVKGQAHFLELKTPKGRQSPEQHGFAATVADAGALYAVVRSPEGARNILEMWRAIPSVSRSLHEEAA